MIIFTYLLQEGPEWTIDEDWILLKVMHHADEDWCQGKCSRSTSG